jgi:hypothetical protein
METVAHIPRFTQQIAALLVLCLVEMTKYDRVDDNIEALHRGIEISAIQNKFFRSCR